MRELIFQLSTLVSTGQNGEHLCIGTISQKGAVLSCYNLSLLTKKKKVNWIKQNGKQLSFAIPHDHHSCDIIYDVCVIKTLNGFAKGKEKKGGKTSDHSNNGAAQLWSCSSAISDIAAIAFNLL